MYDWPGRGKPEEKNEDGQIRRDVDHKQARSEGGVLIHTTSEGFIKGRDQCPKDDNGGGGV